MPLVKTQAEGINLADTFAFTGTLSGVGKILQAVQKHGGEAEDSINYLLKNHENELEKLTKFLESL